MERNKILIIGDTHLGQRVAWGVGKFNIPHRTVDIVKHFENIIDHEIAKGDVLLCIIAGDFLHTTPAIHHHVEKYLHWRVFPKLANEKIGVVIIGGNHDTYPDISQGCMLDNFMLHINTVVLRDFTLLDPFLPSLFLHFSSSPNAIPNNNIAWFKKYIVPNLKKLSACVTFLPFHSLEGFVDTYVIQGYRKSDESKDENALTESIRHIHENFTLQNAQAWIKKWVDINLIRDILKKDESACKHNILIGHYRLEGSKLESFRSASFSTDEINFSREMVRPDLFDLVAFGHIHIPQDMWGLENVKHIGSIEKNNFGERLDHKEYLRYDLSNKKIESISLDVDEDGYHPDVRPQVRPMWQLDVLVPNNESDPTKFIINDTADKCVKLGNPQDAMVKINVSINFKDYKRVNMREVQNKLRSITFFSKIDFIRRFEDEDTGDVEQAEKISLDLRALTSKFINSFSAVENFDIIKQKAMELIDEVLSKEDK